MARITSLLLICCLFLMSCGDGGSNDIEEECGPNASCAPNSSLFGTAWELKQYTSTSGQIESVSEQTKYQMLLEPSTTALRAFIGCVSYSDSTYETNDGYLILRLGVRDGVECNTDTTGFMDQNNAIMDLLAGGDSGRSLPLMFATEYRVLSLEAADGRLLKFEQISQLTQQP